MGRGKEKNCRKGERERVEDKKREGDREDGGSERGEAKCGERGANG